MHVIHNSGMNNILYFNPLRFWSYKYYVYIVVICKNERCKMTAFLLLICFLSYFAVSLVLAACVRFTTTLYRYGFLTINPWLFFRQVVINNNR